jgi:hypothetical protein
MRDQTPTRIDADGDADDVGGEGVEIRATAREEVRTGFPDEVFQRLRDEEREADAEEQAREALFEFPEAEAVEGGAWEVLAGGAAGDEEESGEEDEGGGGEDGGGEEGGRADGFGDVRVGDGEVDEGEGSFVGGDEVEGAAEDD